MKNGTFKLSSLENSENFGFIINGISRTTGASLSSAGDVNGDGKNDIIIGAPGTSTPNAINSGQIYLIFGQSIFTNPLELSNLNGLNGIIINGTADSYAGTSVSSAGDVNGDGKDDIIIGAPYASPDGRNSAGQAYIIFGQSSFTMPFELSNLNGANGFIINGINTNDRMGSTVSSAGDVNGDGKDDVIIGAPYASPYDTNSAGQAYIIFGQSSFTNTLELSSLNGDNGIVINGMGIKNHLGYSVASARDFNGDNKNDVIIGAPGTGQAYVIFGQSKLPSPLTVWDLNNNGQGIVIENTAYNNNAGFSVASAGDFNGDGKDDIMIGSNYADPYGITDAGQVYLIFGQSNAPSPFEIMNINGANGVIINGIKINQNIGCSLSSAGDLNKDGKNDIMIGTCGINFNHDDDQGYLLLGQSNLISPFNLSNLNGTNGITFNTTANCNIIAASAKNINGDGEDEILIGAPNCNRAYVVYASEFFENDQPQHHEEIHLSKGFSKDYIAGITLGSIFGLSLLTFAGYKIYKTVTTADPSLDHNALYDNDHATMIDAAH